MVYALPQLADRGYNIPKNPNSVVGFAVALWGSLAVLWVGNQIQGLEKRQDEKAEKGKEVRRELIKGV